MVILSGPDVSLMLIAVYTSEAKGKFIHLILLQLMTNIIWKIRVKFSLIASNLHCAPNH